MIMVFSVVPLHSLGHIDQIKMKHEFQLCNAISTSIGAM